MWRGTGRPFGRSEGNFATVGGDRRGSGDGVGRWGGGRGGGAGAGSDIDGDTRAAPGEGYHRANGKRSSNELSWVVGEGVEVKKQNKSAPFSAKCEGEGDQTRIPGAAQTQTQHRLTLMSTVTLLLVDPGARKP